MMPFTKDTGTRESDKYCSYCFKDGKLCYEGDLAGFKTLIYQGMIDSGMPWWKAKFFTFMAGFAPRWKQQ
jgi:Putative zinc ribbon domain